ncbi:unnamed protein product [Lymnaea stagnalis]|uniref:Uncharacterized protein n=1 Tax=Lymnaea stagnalis TaxID=6523 RepID=A0AAV2HTW0_LYMST
MTTFTQQNEMCHKILTQQVAALQEVTEHYNKTLLAFLIKVQSDSLSLNVEGNDFQGRFEHMYPLVQRIILYILSKTNEFKGAIDKGSENQIHVQCASSYNAQPAFKLQETYQENETKVPDHVVMKLESLEKNVSRMQKASKEFEEKQESLETALQDLRIQQEDIHEQIELSRHEKNEKNKECHTGLSDLKDDFAKSQVKIETLEQEVKSITDSMKALTSQFFSRNSFEKDAMKSIEDLSNKVEHSEAAFEAITEKVKKLEDSLDTLSCKFSDHLEDPCTLSVEKYDTLDKKYGMLCQLVFKRLSSLEELKDICNRNLTMKDSGTLKIDDIEEKIKEITREIKVIDLKFWEPLKGFSVFAELDLPPHSDFMKDFKRHCALQGVNVDETKGLYPVSVSGFYSISTSVKYKNNTLLNTLVCYTTKGSDTDTEPAECHFLYRLQGDESVTYFTELSEGDLLHLELQDNDNRMHVRIHFSCALMKRYN